MANGSKVLILLVLIPMCLSQFGLPPSRKAQCMRPIIRARIAPPTAVVKITRVEARPAGEVALRNYEELILQMNLMNSHLLNLTMNNSDLFTLNGRVYGFQWINNRFVRLPFPFLENTPPGFPSRPNEAEMLVSLKNRFQPRELNSTQMQCPLYMRVVRQEHYFARFNKIVLVFTSPCMPFPKHKVLLHKSGLRTTLNLTIEGKVFNVQFGGFVRRVVRKRRQRARTLNRGGRQVRRNRFRVRRRVRRGSGRGLKKKGSRRINRLTNKRRNERKLIDKFKENMAGLKNNKGIFKLQKEFGLVKKINSFGEKNLKKKKSKKNKKLTVKKSLFEWGKKRPNSKMQKSKQKIVGKINKREKKRNLKMGKTKNKLKTGRTRKTQQIRGLRQERFTLYRLLNPVHHALGFFKTDYPGRRNNGRLPIEGSDNPSMTPDTLFAQQADILKSLRSFYERSMRIYNQLNRNGTYEAESTTHKIFYDMREKPDRDSPRFGIGVWEFGFIQQTIQRILAEDPRRVDLCQRICRPTQYYYSWDFCLRTCRVKYEFLSNTSDVYQGVNLFPLIRWRRVNSRTENLSFGDDEAHFWNVEVLKRLWAGRDVETCNPTWTSFVCLF